MKALANFRTLVVAACCLAAASAAAAQQRPDTTLTPEQRVWQRLRTLRPVAAPDTQRTANDSLRAQPQQVDVQRTGEPARSEIQGDSVMDLLSRLSGYVSTDYKGGEAIFLADSGHLQLKRDAEVIREGQRLKADTMVDYNENTGIACGYGRPTISGATLESPLTSDTVCYNIEAQLGVAKNAETSISQGANWQLKADVYTRADSMYAHDAQFTDCDLPWPHKHYTFEAGQVKVIQDNVLVARDVTLKFADVPVFWLPFMVQSLSRGRRSGLLMPRFGINDIARTNARYSRRIEDVGFFLAISDYLGAEVAMDWMSSNYTAVRGSLDYTNTKQFLNGGLTFRRFWPDEGGSEFTVSANNSWQPDEFTRLSLSANYSTSTRFVRQRSIDPRELTQTIDSNLNIGRQFGFGSLSLGATRAQYLTDGNVRLTPSASLSINSISLFNPEPGQERWYSNASWSGSVAGRMERFTLGDNVRDVTSQGRQNLAADASSRFNVGKLGLNQSFRFGEDRLFERNDSLRIDDRDTVAFRPANKVQTASWTVGASFQQNLIGTTTYITPSLNLGGEFRRDTASDNRMISAPTRLDFSATLQTALFGFWPGVGPIERIRHRVTPSFSYGYAPEARADSLQRVVFGGAASGIRERNQLTIGISQTFEGKRKRKADGEAPEPVQAMGADSAANDTTSGPRRLPPGESPIILLSLSTDAVLYDFVAARDGRGVQTTSISNSVQSDLFRNLQLRFTHDLWQDGPSEGLPEGELPEREFKPFLSAVSASLRLDSDSWLFRTLGLGRGRTMPEQRGEAGATQPEEAQAGPATDRTKPENGLVGTRRRDPEGTQGGPVGSWNASLDYTLQRPRDRERGSENQMLMANASFQPTENWTMMWRTGYNVTLGEFTDHILTLTRRLHDWDANFDFVKAQNGNFTFQFRVHLRANPDIKLDYEQNDRPAIRQPGF